MAAVLTKTCSILSQAFEQVYVVLKEKQVAGSFDVQCMVYRNYNAPADMLLEKTGFESTAQNLKSFLGKVEANYGWGNEAVEVALQEINKEENIDQVILIGDVGANTKDDTRIKRQRQGEHYWNSNNFPATTFEEEMNTFNSRCPIHTFYLARDAFFKGVSEKTKGQSEKFDIHSENASESLKEFVVCQILQLIQNKCPESNLVGTYKQKCKKMHL